MKWLSPQVHGYFDYTLVIGLVTIPPLLGFAGMPRVLLALLAAFHLSLILVTRYPLGAFESISFRAHGYAEFVTALVLLWLPFAMSFLHQPAVRNFFWMVAAALFLLGLLTDRFVERRTMQLPVRLDRRARAPA